MTDERYKKIMTDLGMPNSQSLLVALQQVANEVEQECAAIERKADAAILKAMAEANSMIHVEQLGGNIVKENWWRGKLTGLRAAEAMRSSV